MCLHRMGKICLYAGEHSFERNVQERGYFMCECIPMNIVIFRRNRDSFKLVQP